MVPNGKHGQETCSTKISADKLFENNLDAGPNLSAQIICSSPKDWDFDEKRLHWASVVRALVALGSQP